MSFLAVSSSGRSSLASSSLPPQLPPPQPIMRRRRRTCVRTMETVCCKGLTYFPLVFVYGVTSWAVWAQIQVGMAPDQPFGHLSALLGVMAYGMLNWSYTTAVFTDPGCPSTSSAVVGGDVPLSSVTVKSTGGGRFCKKCQAAKPDRAHHCSTCRRCVLKMDHHCPWLANCIGLRNYKSFLLFLVYTTLFCWICFATTATWLAGQVAAGTTVDDSTTLPVHFIILAVLSGIIGIVITGFSAWHMYLTATNRTTIESLEKTRYLSPLRHTGDSLPPYPTASEALNRAYEWDRYNAYLDERDNAKLPHAFDLGWQRNVISVLGSNPWLWALPFRNSLGDGWTWEQSQHWQRQREALKREREAESMLQEERGHANGSTGGPTPHPPPPPPPRRNWAPPGNSGDEGDVEDSSDEEDGVDGRSRLLRSSRSEQSAFEMHPGQRMPSNWNDVPDDMLGSRSSSARRQRN